MKCDLARILPLALVCLFAASASTSAGEMQTISTTLWGNAVGVRVAGAHAYVATTGGLVVLDLSDPEHPTRVGEVPGIGWIAGLDLAGNFVYLAGDEAGIHVIDVSDPANPELVTTRNTPGQALAIVIRNNLAFVADGFSGLCVYDLTNPANPVLIGHEDTDGQARDISLMGDYAFLADLTYGIAVFDIHDPAHPIWINQISEFVADVMSVWVDGDELYVIDSIGWKKGGGAAEAQSSIAPRQGSEGRKARTPDMAYLRVLDVADPLSPALLDTLHFREGAYAACAGGGVVYVASHIVPGHVFTVDASNPGDLSRLGAVETGGAVYEVIPGGADSYAAIGASGLVRLDLSSPAGPAVTGSWWEASSIHNVTVQGDHAYVADIEFGMHIVDVSNPASPVVTASLDTPARPKRIAILDDHAYLAGLDDGLVVVDVADPWNPQIVDTEPGKIWSVRICGQYAYLAADDQGLQILDVSDPADPFLVGSCALPGKSLDLVVRNGLAYLATIGAGMQIVDVSNPQHPVREGGWYQEESFSRLVMEGDWLYLDDGWDGVRVVSLEDPIHPAWVAQIDPGFPCYALEISEGRLFFGGSTPDGSFLGLFDVTNPRYPETEAILPIPGAIRGLDAVGSHLYAALDAHLAVLSLPVSGVEEPGADGTDRSGGEAAGALPSYPRLDVRSPTAGRILCEISVSRPGSALLELFDASGRRRAWRAEELPASGPVEVDWDVRTLPAGIYFLRLTAEGQARNARIVLVDS